jgi:hypothetical protein
MPKPIGPERPFSRIDVGEDNAFVWSPEPKRMPINVRDELYVATIHRGNTKGQRWYELPAQRLEALMRAVDLQRVPSRNCR